MVVEIFNSAANLGNIAEIYKKNQIILWLSVFFYYFCLAKNQYLL
jgi:hypothetical protein